MGNKSLGANCPVMLKYDKQRVYFYILVIAMVIRTSRISKLPECGMSNLCYKLGKHPKVKEVFLIQRYTCSHEPLPKKNERFSFFRIAIRPGLTLIKMQYQTKNIATQ